MLFDAHNLFCEQQVVTASAASQTVVDIGIERDIAVDNDLYVAICNEGVETGAGNMKVALQTSDDEIFTTPVTLFETPSLDATELNGKHQRFGIKMPHDAKRYLRLYFTVSGSMAGNSMKCGIVNGFDHHPLYNKAVHH